MIYNGIKKDFVRVNMELFRPPTPPIQFITSEKPTGGDRVYNKRFAGMELPVPITIRSNRRIEELKQELSDWLVHDEPKKLEFVDMSGLYYLAYYQGMELNERYRFAKGVITFYLPVAYRFGADKSLNIGTSFANHNVTGQVATLWVSRTVFSGETRNYTLDNGRGGKIVLNYTFGENDVLEIDYEKRLIKLNGVARMPLLSLDSNWFKLQPGINRLRASHETVVTYRETYY